MNTKNKQIDFSYLLIHIILIFGVIIMVVPFLWMILTSLKSFTESVMVPPVIIPEIFRWDNYVKIIKELPFGIFYYNTIIITLARTAGQLLICSMAAYSFARLEFPGKNILFVIMLTVLMVPGQIFLIPNYITMEKLGLLNTLRAVILPGLFSAYGTFLLRQFFMTLPKELEESAKIDGCTTFGIYWKIMMPLAKPGLVSLAIFTILWSWNELLWPLIVNSSVFKMTLSPGLASLQGEHGTDYTLLMAGAVLAIWPMITMFFVFQKQFIEGIALTGTKG